jgi:hypothetical protein
VKGAKGTRKKNKRGAKNMNNCRRKQYKDVERMEEY